jgi:hypothetical protein
MIRTPVLRVLDADLATNFHLLGGGVIRVDHATEAAAVTAGDKLVGGALTPVYFVSTAQLASQRFHFILNRPTSAETFTFEGNMTRGIKGRAAIPVYDPTVVP